MTESAELSARVDGDAIFRVLRGEILAGVHPPGTALREVVISERFGVSRTPVREALKRLELDRLVVSYPRRGTFATRVEVTDLAFISEIRLQLEPLAAARAARVATRPARRSWRRST